MPVLSYLHQLFSADTCHAYIHLLRWQKGSLRCPRCQSHERAYRSGGQYSISARIPTSLAHHLAGGVLP
jgi:hypothetical protein